MPFNSWCCEAQWQKYDAETLNLNGMVVDGFNHQGYGLNRYCYSGKGTWSTCEYLPIGIAEDRETGRRIFSRLKAPDSGWQNMALHRAEICILP